MMTTLMMLNVVCAGGITFCLWALRCNKRTYNERVKLLDKIRAYDGKDWEVLLSAYRAVSYSAHHRALLFGRDAMLLYPNVLRVL